MPEDNNLDDLSISEILDLYKDTIETDDGMLSAMCARVKTCAGCGVEGETTRRL